MEKLYQQLGLKHFSIGAHQSGMAQRSMDITLDEDKWEIWWGLMSLV